MDIEIPKELAEAEAVPEDLDANVAGPFLFPNPGRRRLAAWAYATTGVFALISAQTFLTPGMSVVGIVFLALAGYQLLAAEETHLDEKDALTKANVHAGFAVGHASAALRFVGFRSYPVWNVLMYDAKNPPTLRALVLVDAVTGELRAEPYTEEIPTEVG